MGDIDCRLHALSVYPVKSCAGIELQRSELCDTGLALDRAWMLIDERGNFVTQRELPRLALIRPSLQGGQLRLHAAGRPALWLPAPAPADAPRVQVQVWHDNVSAWDMGAQAAMWCSEFIGRPLRLLRFDDTQRRVCERRWTGAATAHAAFADAFSLLVSSTASLAELNRRLLAQGEPAVAMQRFRPNLVLDGIDAHDEDHIGLLEIDTPQGTVRIRLVKPCVRCSIPGVDPDSGEQGYAVTDTLASYRADARMDGAVTFGMNAIVLDGVGCELAAGQRCRASYAF